MNKMNHKLGLAILLICLAYFPFNLQAGEARSCNQFSAKTLNKKADPYKKLIEKAAKNNKVKIASINDFTADTVNIEIKLPRGVYAKDVVDSLYAFTECEQTIYCNLLVIRDNMPVQMTVTDVIKFHAKQLVAVLKDELDVERAELLEKLHLRTLERIFIEERIYKKIEQILDKLVETSKK